jgi:hypothetical protein
MCGSGSGLGASSSAWRYCRAPWLFAASDYLLSRSWLWAILVVPMVVGSIGFLVWFDRHAKS